jgi:VIT1/CCC1 family predicted Fe2+/Mn2+ transporter
VQAAIASAATFAVGAGVPLIAVATSAPSAVSATVTAVSLVLLAVLGWVAASAGGASGPRGAARVAFWGVLAMALTWGAGRLFGAAG